MLSLVAAMSRASTSAVNRAKAFLVPSGRMRVLILTVSTSYCFLRACLIWRLLALVSTMKTRVLFSSIFFIADSVLSGWMRILPASRRGCLGMETRGYLGARLCYGQYI